MKTAFKSCLAIAIAIFALSLLICAGHGVHNLLLGYARAGGWLIVGILSAIAFALFGSIFLLFDKENLR